MAFQVIAKMLLVDFCGILVGCFYLVANWMTLQVVAIYIFVPQMVLNSENKCVCNS